MSGGDRTSQEWVHKRGENRSGTEQDKGGEQQQDDDERQEPPFLLLAEELDKLKQQAPHGGLM